MLPSWEFLLHKTGTEKQDSAKNEKPKAASGQMRIHLSHSFRPPLFVGLPEGYQIFYAPQPILQSSPLPHLPMSLAQAELTPDIFVGNTFSASE